MCGRKGVSRAPETSYKNGMDETRCCLALSMVGAGCCGAVAAPSFDRVGGRREKRRPVPRPHLKECWRGNWKFYGHGPDRT